MSTNRLEDDDPKNRALVAYQLAFNHVYGQCQELIDGILRRAAEDGYRGWLDVKATRERGRLRLHARLRSFGAPVPRGQWFTLPVVPEVLAEFFDRIEPEPEPSKNEVREIDAAKDDGEAPDPTEQVKARGREAAALESNIRRTQREVERDWSAVDSALAALKSALAEAGERRH